MDISTTSTTITDNQGSQPYPYPSHVNAASFVSIKLSGKPNYMAWQKQVLCLACAHDMIGFLDGTIKKPEENNGSKMEANKTAFESKCWEWTRSDTLVQGWMYGSLSEDVMGTVVDLQTANQVWYKLWMNFAAPPASLETNKEATTSTTTKKELGYYLPLFKAIQMGNWDKAQEFFIKDKDMLTDKLNYHDERSIHIASGNTKNVWFLEKLLNQIDPESLPNLLSNKKQNALHHAAVIGNIEAAKKLVEKNPDLLFFGDFQRYLPIHRAVINAQKTTLLYLIQVCKQYIEHSKKEGCHNPFEGEMGVWLLGETMLSGYLDVAYNLLNDYPDLATKVDTNGKSPLWCLASTRNAYPSAERYNFYQRFVYYHIPTDVMFKVPDIENQERHGANLVTMSYIYQAIRRTYVKFWKVSLLKMRHIKHLHEDKGKHIMALMMLNFICEEVAKLKSDSLIHFGNAFLSAVNNDTVEVVEQIIRTFPEAVMVTDLQGKSFQQLSILKRCERVYNLLVHNVTYDKHLHKVIIDNNNNNLLHMVGHMAPNDKLSMVTGAALQMQRELQWFQEVSKFVHPRYREAKNIEDQTTFMVFREKHEDLRRRGEEWIKKTADSCTITTSLIITIAFAAAITVPGGNNGDTGNAIYENRLSFIIFVISNTISLFTSTTSLLLFLSILTARYAEEDFLYKLPNRLIFGQLMLFMSVITMMIAFSATIYVSSGHGKSWILIPIAALTCLPIASFVKMQLPLLIDLISSTYGQGIFGKKSDLHLPLLFNLVSSTYCQGTISKPSELKIKS